MTVPRSVEEVDSAWLSSVLQRDIEVCEVEPVGVGATFTSVLFRLHLSGDGAPPAVIVKLPLPGEEERAPAVALGLYHREITWYRDLAATAPIRSPKPYLAEAAEAGSDFVIVMEDLAPLEAADQIVGLTVAQGEAVADRLARFHAWSWEHERLADLAAVFPPLDSPMGRAVNEQLAALFAAGWSHYRQLASDLPEPAVEFADRFAELVPRLIDELASPRTLVHGELRSDNLFFDTTGQPILVDFQVAQQEAGIRDLAYVISQSLPTHLRREHEPAIMRRYWDGLVDAGIGGYPLERAQRQYRLAVGFGMVYPMVAFTRYDLSSDRGKEVLMTMLDRATQAIADHAPLDLLDAR